MQARHPIPQKKPMTYFAKPVAIFAIFALSCSTFLHCDPGTNPPPPPPTQTKEISLSAVQYELPAETFSKEGFYTGNLSQVGTLLGNKGGLYHLNNNKLNTLDLDPVVGIAPWRGQYLLVAGPKQLSIFDGAIEPLNLNEKLHLDKTELTSIAAQSNDTMWIGTKEHLWRLQHDTLQAFPDIKSVEQIIAYPGAKEVAVIANKGQITILRTDEKGEIQSYQMPADSPSFTQLFPSLEGSLWGYADKKLFLRETKDGQSRWVPYIFGATADNPEGETISHATLDNTTGQIWAVGTQHIFVLSAAQAQQAVKPKEITKIVNVASAGGTFWISDGAQLHLFSRQNDENITYEGQVSAFLKQNCLRCHEQVGPGRPLDTYDIVKQQVQSIISQMESGAMPADKAPVTNGSVDTFKQWIKNNYSK